MATSLHNVTLNEKQAFKATKKTIHVKNNQRNTLLSELYFRKIGQNFFVYMLGKNGEAKANRQILIYAKHKDFDKTEEYELFTDKEGKVGLGQLNNILWIKAEVTDLNDNGGEGDLELSDKWMVCQKDTDTWTQPNDLHIIEGESIELPINCDKDALKENDASLVRLRDGKILENMFSRIKISKVECGKYHLLRLDGLEIGEYTLKLKQTANQEQRIDITVHKGEYWQGNFILKKNCIFESSAQKNALRINEIFAKNSSATETLFKIQLTNFTKETRVHAFATQFQSNNSCSLSRLLNKASTDQISGTNFPFAQWNNIFDSNKTIDDEIKYVFDRQKKENKMGN